MKTQVDQESASFDYESRNPLKSVNIRDIEKAIAAAISELSGYRFECSLAQIEFDDKSVVIRRIHLHEPTEVFVESVIRSARG